jgi:hypothetical protein
MKELKTERENEWQAGLQMKPLVDHLVNSVTASSVKRRNLLINDVPAGLPTVTDQNLLALLLGNIINDVVCHTENDCIRISASKNGSVATISLKSNTIAYDKSFALCLETIQVIAQTMGAVVSISNHETGGVILDIYLIGNIKAA